jgi:hypothetical protein
MKPIMRICIPAVAAAFILQASGEPDYVEGEVLVLYKQSASTQSTAAAEVPGQSRKTFARLSNRAGKKMQLIADHTRTTAELMAVLKTQANVEAVSPNYIKRICAPVRIPDDTQFASQWALCNTAQNVNGTTGTADCDIDFTDARRLMMDNPPEAVIAIIDTGVDYTHLDLQGAMWVNTNEAAGNGIDDDGNGYIDDIYGYDFAGDRYTDPVTGSTNANDGADSDPADILDHGTHLAGIAAAVADNARGIAGVGRLKIMALKASLDGAYLTDSATIDAANYILEMKSRGINIVAVNASYGGAGSNAVEKAAIETLRDAGIILCAAAGNDGTNNDSTPFYPAGYAVSNILSIAATDSSDKLASYSNHGQTTVDVAAPGSLILSCYPPHLGSAASVKRGTSTYSATGMSFSGITDSSGLSGILYNCGRGYTNEFPSGVAGNIALIERGEIQFAVKVANAMNAGAIAAVVYNNVAGGFGGTLSRPHRWIPSVGISQANGQTLLTVTGQTVTVVNQQNESTSYQYKNGTSMATPVATGAIGVLAQHFPDDSVTERIRRLLDNADPVASLSTNCVTGARLNLCASLDSDGDELPDWWELESAATLSAMNGASDTDGDGMSDLAEYRTGTDPKESSSVWSVAAAAGGDTLQFSWASQTGCTYRVLSSTNLVTGPFEEIDSTSATPPLNQWDTPTTNGAARFFRVEQIWE